MIDTVQRAKQALWDSYHELNPHIFVDSQEKLWGQATVIRY